MMEVATPPTATETINGYVLHPGVELARGRTTGNRSAPPHRKTAAPPPLPTSPRNADFPRSASYTYLPAAKDSPYGEDPSVVRIKGRFHDDAHALIAPADSIVDISPPESSGFSTPEEEEKPSAETTATNTQQRDLVAELQKSPKIATQPLVCAVEDDTSSTQSSFRWGSVASTSKESLHTVSTTTSAPTATPRLRGSVNSSFSRAFNRKSWYSTSPSTHSRSLSPPKSEPTSKRPVDIPNGAPTISPVGVTDKFPRRKSFLRRRDSMKPAKEKKAVKVLPDSGDEVRPVTRRTSILRPVSGLFRSPSSDNLNAAPPLPLTGVPPVPSLPKSFSTDKLPTYRSNTPLPDRAAPMPRLLSSERVPSSGLALPRKKDELWSVFRNLDGDFSKFLSKSTAFKANVVRNALIPFLRTYAMHSSNRMMRPEDLDRRTNILNKWWTGLIEMLHGRNNQSISGTDRPVILDGISGIMERPEWRLSPQFCPVIQRTVAKGQSSPFNRSTTSLASSNSEFLTESVYRNARNIFIQNLSSQMAFVVDKMSLRNASASLVTFCGKACAYAFMFVPGMADVLVRLWDLQMDTIRRVLDEIGIGKFDIFVDTAAKVVPAYPPALHQLGFTSLMKLMRKLRIPPPLPLGTANIQWWGHWLERWTGRESDLFYVFVKHYHILAVDFLQPNATKNDRMCAPGMVLVHAQILTNLDATIHRDATNTQQDAATAGTATTFDDLLADPDAVATAIPVAPTNAVRIMAENRLIMLIRDFLSERTADHPIARQLFAESFNDLLQASARGTSVFDHAACYTLLDFLEEALVILVRFEHIKGSEGTIIDSAFWQSVCKRMISSHNTMTEIRLYAFLYTVWNTVMCDLGRKSNICLGLLLDAETFESRFNHWCPMVRAYYMRLLCWRVGRYDGEASAGDVMILETMRERLLSTWSYYMYLCEQAAKKRVSPPPTNPCNPAPGRRLLIMRTDLQVNAGGSFLSFDGLMAKPTSGQAPTVSKRFSALSNLTEMDVRPGSALSKESADTLEVKEKSIGSFFRKIIGGPKSRQKTDAPIVHPPRLQSLGRPPPSVRPARAATDDGQIPRARTSATDTASTKSPTTPTLPHRNFTFKFSLDYHANNKSVPGQMRLYPPRLPMPAQVFLQELSSQSGPATSMTAVEPQGDSIAHARYCGRALAEWMLVVGECQSFYERRKNEGVPSNKLVETPTMGVEVFRRPS